MAQLSYNDLLDAGVHFGHLTRKWDPKMAPYIFMEKNGIHIIDLNKTISSLEEASAALRSIVRSGRKVMFVATKKQAQEIVTTEADKLKMPYVTDRWLGGMLTNFATVRKSIKKMSSIDKMLKDEVIVKTIAKRERLMLTREEEKLKRVLGGITDLTRLPAALFVVDVKREHIAVSEAKKLGIPVFAMCDTNSNPDLVDYPIPANDDAYKSISIIITAISKAIEEGLAERKQDKDDAREAEEVEAKKAADDDSQEAAKVAAKYEKEAEQE
ncbi:MULTISPECIES: 30S ribosomal protein S2 [Aquirufa]|jgi:small subunit ribosomal protein S2|uniref:Small ribosomal subunit protein uS2 n=4 Tax=Aquirufa TaxID=2676247 RepID=A0A4Q9BE00_9BACT|nr:MULTISPECIES: 30S ribosomal protein S2 [Aquirufa]MCE4217142.1 30S ribosomal protein S2 [Pseudarcicella sp. GAP-15]MCZ2478383.1 30S ribosomal protein S2 [Aquirufa antheringensis]MCZ2484394.1 30S ribosomal protein S2 [Aquirufa antheringensis]MCZ2487737.1 30S ribosomal protein S2 [Aquirufa antheringensis]MCZ2489438.1 30S ribosomal protein S2 [Aquirufa antheringensis]